MLTDQCQKNGINSADVLNQPQGNPGEKQLEGGSKGVADQERHDTFVTFRDRYIFGHAVDHIDIQPHRGR